MADKNETDPWASVTPDTPAPPLAGTSASAPPPPDPGTRIGGQDNVSIRSWKPGIMELRPQGFGDYLGIPFRATRVNAGPMIGGPLIFTVIAVAAAVPFGYFLINDPFLSNYLYTTDLGFFSQETIIAAAAAIFIGWLADIFASSILVPGVSHAILGERIRIPRAWAAIRGQIGHLILLHVVWGIAVTVLMFVWIWPIMIVDGGGAAGLMFLGFFPVVAAGLWLTALKGVAVSVVVLEKSAAFPAIRRTLWLTRGRAWWGVLLALVTYLMYFVFSFIVSLVGQSLASGALLVGGDNYAVGITIFAILYAIAQVIAYLPLYFFVWGAFVGFYIDLRIRKEGFDQDLAEAAEARATT